MLKFFRRIRRKLIDESNLRKYLVYAIGEILLVVIGIVIALQINNWNEQRITTNTELEILNDLKNILELDLEALKVARNTNSRIKSSINVILEFIEEDRPYHDSLKYHFGNTNHIWPLRIDRSVFETLISHGINIVQNKELRKKIVVFYNAAEGTFKTSQDKYRDYLFDASKNFYMKRFDQFWYSNYEEWRKENLYYSSDYDPFKIISEKTPIDFEELKRDKDYLYFLKTLRNLYDWSLEWEADDLIYALINLIDSIDQELSEREKYTSRG